MQCLRASAPVGTLSNRNAPIALCVSRRRAISLCAPERLRSSLISWEERMASWTRLMGVSVRLGCTQRRGGTTDDSAVAGKRASEWRAAVSGRVLTPPFDMVSHK
jgi:hypothetical protein